MVLTSKILCYSLLFKTTLAVQEPVVRYEINNSKSSFVVSMQGLFPFGVFIDQYIFKLGNKSIFLMGAKNVVDDGYNPTPFKHLLSLYSYCFRTATNPVHMEMITDSQMYAALLNDVGK